MFENITIMVAFTAGLLSFFSPCLLPIIPAYFMYLTTDFEDVTKGPQSPLTRHAKFKKGLIRTFGFVLGFTTVFIVLGLGVTAIGQIFVKNQNLLTKISGAFIIFFGLTLTGMIKIPFLMQDKRRFTKGVSAFGLGAAFGFGWTPCFGPVLGSILATTAVSNSFVKVSSEAFLQGAVLLFVYSLGLAVPFLLSYFFLSFFESKLHILEKHASLLSKLAGFLMILLGLIILSGNMQKLVNSLSFQQMSPPFVATAYAEELQSPPSDEALDARALKITNGNRNFPQLALTFDDGGEPSKVAHVLDVLKKHNVSCTFFFTGEFIQRHPNLMKRLHNEGHEMGNHSWGHPRLVALTNESVLSELTRSDNAYLAATGKNMAPFVRPTYGAHDERTGKLFTQAGFAYNILWDVDTNDWKGFPAQTIHDHVLQHARNGSIVLMHTTRFSESHNALDRMITSLKSQGYDLVTVGELVRNMDSETLVKAHDIPESTYYLGVYYVLTGNETDSIKTAIQEFAKYGFYEKPSPLRPIHRDRAIRLMQKLYPHKNGVAEYFSKIPFTRMNLSKILKVAYLPDTP